MTTKRKVRRPKAFVVGGRVWASLMNDSKPLYLFGYDVEMDYAIRFGKWFQQAVKYLEQEKSK